MDLTTIGEAERGHVNTSCEYDQCKIDESVVEKEVGGQCLPRICPDGQGG